MEYRTTNVKFQCLVPLLVATKMSHYESDEANFLVVSPTVYARQAVDALAMYDISPGCVAHEIQVGTGNHDVPS
jgi:short-subunit dehydrogenase